MWNVDRVAAPGEILSREEIARVLADGISRLRGYAKKILLLPPDYTRMHSHAGEITALLVRECRKFAKVDVLPALGTHAPMTETQCCEMFEGEIDHNELLVHNWRTDVARLGEVPAAFVEEVSEGLVHTPVAVELNRRILDPSYDCILSIGQVVPHEVVGMANGNKNLFVGCGGHTMINTSHMLGAFYGLERLMGLDHSPVRRVFDYAEAHFCGQLPLTYILTVCTGNGVQGLFIGRDRSHFEKAVALSRQVNITRVRKPIEKAVVYLDPGEYKSTWLGNKAVYRARMAMANGGELLVLAPGVCRFGEDDGCDRLIRKFGYCGRENVLALCEEQPELSENLSAAAHLIHGSSDGRFRICYATQHLSKEEIEGVGYAHMPYAEAVSRYAPEKLSEGWNRMPDGESIYFIKNPALGLWALEGGNA